MNTRVITNKKLKLTGQSVVNQQKKFFKTLNKSNLKNDLKCVHAIVPIKYFNIENQNLIEVRTI